MRLSRTVVGLAIVTGIIAGILIDVKKAEGVHVVAVAEASEATTTPQEVRIEVVTDWTRERIEQEVYRVFKESAPMMIKVMQCEGGYNTKAFNPTNGSDDKGLFQISTKYHGEQVMRLGLDMYNPIDNIAYAKILYDEQGLDPWIWSKPCWSK